MKTIVDDPEGFFEQGGWSFLEPEGEVRECGVSFLLYNSCPLFGQLGKVVHKRPNQMGKSVNTSDVISPKLVLQINSKVGICSHWQRFP